MKQGIEKISTGLHQLLGEAETLLKSTADTADEKLDEATRTSREALQRVCDQLREARGELEAGARRIEDAVRSHPWKALAATALVSFIAGLLVRRR